MRGRRRGARNTTSLANFAEDGRIEVRYIKTLYTMNVYDYNAEFACLSDGSLFSPKKGLTMPFD